VNVGTVGFVDVAKEVEPWTEVRKPGCEVLTAYVVMRDGKVKDIEWRSMGEAVCKLVLK